MAETAMAGLPQIDVDGKSASPEPEQAAPATIQEMLRDVGAHFRASLDVDRAAYQDQRHQHYTSIAEYIKNADKTLTFAERFAEDSLPGIRTRSDLAQNLRTIHQSLSAVVREGQRINEDIVSLMSNEGAEQGGKISGILDSLAQRAQTVSRALTRSQRDYSDEVLGRELQDSRLAKIDGIQRSVSEGLEYRLKRDSILPDAAKDIIRNSVHARLESLLGPVKQDPLAGMVEQDAVAAAVKTAQSIKSIKIPGSTESYELSPELTKMVTSVYTNLQSTVERARAPQETQRHFPGTDVYAVASLDDMGTGTVTFHHTASAGSKVEFKISGDTEHPSLHLERVKNLLDGLDIQGQTESASPAWNRERAARFYQLLVDLSGGELPEINSKPILPAEELPGYTIVANQGIPMKLALDIMSGHSEIIIRKEDQFASYRPEMRITLNSGELEVAIVAAKQDGMPQDLDFRVAVPTSALRHNKSLESTVQAVAKAFAADQKHAELDGKPNSAISRMSAIPDAAVRKAHGIAVVKEGDLRLKLAPVHSVAGILVTGEAYLSIEGTAAARSSGSISGVRSERESVVDLNVTEVTMSNCHFKGLLAGYIQNSTLHSVFADKVQKHLTGSPWAQAGQPLTDEKCDLTGCSWKVAIGQSLAALKGTRYLGKA